MTNHLTEDDLVLHYYGEMAATDETRAAGHLAACPACHAGYTRLQRVLAAVDAAPGPEIADGFERTVWARLEPDLRRDRTWFSWLVFSPARLALGGAVAALVTIAFLAGREWRPQPDAITPPVSRSASASQLRERVLLADLGEHLDRSQMMLVDLVSADDSGPVDITAERDRAEQLVAANRLYRQTAAATGDRAVAAVLDELERMLVEVAASPTALSPTDMDDVRRRIDAAGLLFKVQVVSSQIRERQKKDVRAMAGQSS